MADTKVPEDIQKNIERGRQRREVDMSLRNECLEFYRGNQYVYRLPGERYLSRDGTLVGERGKPRHEIRQKRNLIFDIVEREVASTSQRVPGYQVMPSNIDPESISGANIAGKMLRYGYDKWDTKLAVEQAIRLAVVAREGFVWPYFNNRRGAVISKNDQGDSIFAGEIETCTLSAEEVSWQPNIRFEKSRWYSIERAQPIKEVQAMTGYIGGKLTADATLSPYGPTANNDLVMVTDYLERPSEQFPDGRRLTMANKKRVVPDETYPRYYMNDGQRVTLDEPPFHRIEYAMDPDDRCGERGMGLVEHLLDSQRTFNAATNIELMWMILAQNPQGTLRNGQLSEPMSNEPGKIFTLKGNNDIQWRPVPQIPVQLSTIRNEARDDMQRIAAQLDVPTQIEAGKALATWYDQAQERRKLFIGRVAQLFERLGRHYLQLVQVHYTEERDVIINGRWGPELLSSFTAAKLCGQENVTVSEQSIESRTREAMEQQVMAYADRGWISGQTAMAAINSGTTETLIEDFELDVEWANHCIQMIRGTATGATQPEQIPQAREFDNHKVQIAQITSWMKTQDFALLPPGTQEFATLLITQHKQMEAQDLAVQAEQQQQVAAGYGMANAAKPQATPPLPVGGQ